MAPTADSRSLSPAAAFTPQAFQEAANQMMTTQATFFREAVEGQLAMLAELRATTTRLTAAQDQATFKTRVTSGGRISADAAAGGHPG
ncbi:MAG TPA: hypothetical protein VNZ52_04120, partial [Candidatus Thermoplasmatota archaeon]|nr:hypothetical protein [Candidatus Thermoplasmatota archaeon]